MTTVIKLHDYQKATKQFMIDHPKCAVFLPMGLGKDQPLDALVLTPSGFRTMGEMTIGTEVIVPSGGTALVDGVFPQGVRPVYELTLDDGRTVRAGKDHLWTVSNAWQRHEGYPPVVKNTLELLEDLTMKNGDSKWYIEAIAEPDLGQWSSSLDPYLIGVLLGDGSLSQSVPMVSTPDQEILDDVARMLPAGVTPKWAANYDYRLTSPRGQRNALTDELRRLGIMGKLSVEKSIPQQLLHVSADDRLALLQGLLDTDGHALKTGFDLVLGSEQLLDDARWLVHSLGGRATKMTKVVNGKEYFRLYGRLPQHLSPFRLSRKAAVYGTGIRTRYPTVHLAIRSIEYVGEEHTQCISVDHPDHEYVTDQFVRTHNTLVTLSALADIQPSGHILVIAPLNIVRSTWIDEIEKWGFPVRTKSLIVNERGNKLSRKKRLERYAEIATDPPTMYFINQDLVDDLIQNMPTQSVNGRKTFVWPFGTVIIDESQGLKSPSSKRFKALKRVAPATTRIIEMTGTPTPNGLLDLWSQIYLLDEGLALGRTFTQYRERYFRPTQYVNNRPVKWELLPGAEKEIYQRISHLVMSIENTALTLPPLTVNDVRVHLADKEQELYEEMKRELVLTFTDKSSGSQEHVTAPNAGVLAARLIQIASGTIYTGPNHKHEVIHNQKIEHCDYILRNTTSPTIIAYRFVSDREQLLKQLRDRGHDVQVFDGSREMIKQWNERKIQVMLLQPASAGHGLNLQQGGSSMIWYTLPWSLEHYAQTNARLHRQGQKDPVVIHRLITQKTFDTRLPKILENKDGVQQGLMDAVLMEVDSTDLGAPLSKDTMYRMVDEDWLDYIEDYGVDDTDRF